MRKIVFAINFIEIINELKTIHLWYFQFHYNSWKFVLIFQFAIGPWFFALNTVRVVSIWCRSFVGYYQLLWLHHTSVQYLAKVICDWLFFKQILINNNTNRISTWKLSFGCYPHISFSFYDSGSIFPAISIDAISLHKNFHHYQTTSKTTFIESESIWRW